MLAPGSKRLRDLDPHVALGGSVTVVLLAEYAAVKQGSAAWVVVGAAASFAAFFVAWRAQERLRLVPILVLSLAFQLAWIALHLHLGVSSIDSAVLYRRWGNSLLHGHYPDAQYPPAGAGERRGRTCWRSDSSSPASIFRSSSGARTTPSTPTGTSTGRG